MAGILRLLKCVVIFTMVNSRVFAEMSTLTTSFEKHHVVPGVVPKAPNDLVTIEYPSGVSVKEGNVLTPRQVKDIPTVKWQAESDKIYTLIMSDPDVGRNNPDVKQWQHWIVVNIPGDNVSAGDELFEYRGSGPPAGSGLHRYIFLVYKQQMKLTINDPVLLNESLINRGEVSLEELTTTYNLGVPVAGNFFLAEYDDYVPEFYKLLQEKYNFTVNVP